MIGGSGVLLPPPSAPYPAYLYNGSQAGNTNQVSLPAGSAVIIPAGMFLVAPGSYGKVQILDPVTGVWRPCATAKASPIIVNSDGTNFRVANLTGCVVAVEVTSGGSGYSSSTPPAVTAAAGGATFQSIVGGAVGSIALNSGGSGSGYTLTPLVIIDAPTGDYASAGPGIAATALASISGGVLTGITIVNEGAGYPAVPNVVVVPNPLDPNAGAFGSTGTYVNGAVTAALTGSGQVTGILVTGAGAPQTATPVLTVAAPASGLTATASAIMDFVITSFTVSGGSAYSGNVGLITTGGTVTAANAYTGPAMTTGFLQPRQATGTVALLTGVLSSATVIDGGEFQAAPNVIIVSSTAPATVGTATASVGGVTETIFITPLGGIV